MMIPDDVFEEDRYNNAIDEAYDYDDFEDDEDERAVYRWHEEENSYARDYLKRR